MKTEKTTIKTTAIVQRVPYWQNHYAIKRIETRLDYSLKLIQDAITSCPIEITLEELKSCLGQDPYRKVNFNQIESLLRKKMLGKVDLEKIRVMGLKMNEEKLKGMLDIPDYHAFSESLKLFGNMIPGSDPHMSVLSWNCFTLNDGIVTINNEAEKMKDQHRDYPQTDEEEDRVNRVQIICDLLNALKADFNLLPFRLELENLILLDANDVLCPSDVFVRTKDNMGNMAASFSNVVKANPTIVIPQDRYSSIKCAENEQPPEPKIPTNEEVEQSISDWDKNAKNYQNR